MAKMKARKWRRKYHPKKLKMAKALSWLAKNENVAGGEI
jgi:hypothetical protein